MANPWEMNWRWDDLPAVDYAEGLQEYGSAPTNNLPRKINPDGSVSTLRSMSFNENGNEVLIPTVSADARRRTRVMTDKEAVERYRRTGLHLGKFDTPDNATKYAQELSRDQAQQGQPWTLNWDWGKAEASAAAQDQRRIEPLATVGDNSVFDYVQDEEYQLPELLHEEPSQVNFHRPAGEKFHARSFVQGAAPEQRIMGDEPEMWRVPLHGFARAGEDVAQTAWSYMGGDPRDIPTMPLTVLDRPITADDAWDNPVIAFKQAATMANRMAPLFLAGLVGAAVSAPAAGATGAAAVGTEILGASAMSMVATWLQSMGPRFKAEVMKTPDDPDGAWERAGNATLIDVGATGLGGILLGGPFGASLKQNVFHTFGLAAAPVLTGRQLAGNLAFQTLGVQPAIGVANMKAVDAYLDQHTGLTTFDEYLNNLAPGLVQTGAEMVGRRVFGPKGAPVGGPDGPRRPHFTDDLAEASDLEKLAADFRTTPEGAAEIPEGLRYQIEGGEDPYKDFRDDRASVNSALPSKLGQVIESFPAGTKMTGQQWYNTLKNKGVKDEELADMGLDQMLVSNHEVNQTKTWSLDQVKSQYEHNNYLLKEQSFESESGDTLYGPDEGYEALSTVDGTDYRENITTIPRGSRLSLPDYAARRGISEDKMRTAANRGDQKAEDAYALLMSEYQEYNRYLNRNPAWQKMHAPGEFLEGKHFKHVGNQLFHTRTQDLDFPDGKVSHHLEESQSDRLQAMDKGKPARNLPLHESLQDFRYAQDELSEATAGDKSPLRFIDQAAIGNWEMHGQGIRAMDALKSASSQGLYKYNSEHLEGLIRYAENPESFSPEARAELEATIDRDKAIAQLPEMKAELARVEAAQDRTRQAYELANGPANLPHKKSWSKVALKNEIHRALAEGKRMISWASGEMQARRYSLAKRVGEITVFAEKSKAREGTYSVVVKSRDMLSEVYNKSYISKSELNDLVGRKLSSTLTDKADASPDGKATVGKQEIGKLEVGGGFHKKLYDEKMVQWASEIGKRFGKKPELVRRPGADFESWGRLQEAIIDDSDVAPENYKTLWNDIVRAIPGALNELHPGTAPHDAMLGLKRNMQEQFAHVSDPLVFIPSATETLYHTHGNEGADVLASVLHALRRNMSNKDMLVLPNDEKSSAIWGHTVQEVDKIWRMELVPEMRGSMLRYQVEGDERKLVAVRHMDYATLRKALEVGGIPRPSIAIMNPEIGIGAVSKFGDSAGAVTLIATRDMIDPQRGEAGSRVYSADAYTAGTPATRYVPDPAKVSLANKLLRGVADMVRGPTIQDATLEKVKVMGIEALADNHAIVTTYAIESGKQKKSGVTRANDGEGVKALRAWALADDGFLPWLATKFGDIIATRRIVSKPAIEGRAEKLSRFTLTAMVRAMSAVGDRGAKHDYKSIGYYRAVATRKFNTIEEIKSASGKIISADEASAVLETIEGKFSAAVDEIKAMRAERGVGDHEDGRLAKNFIASVARHRGSARKIAEEFQHVTAREIAAAENILRAMQDTAAPYFEAKGKTAVSFDEWATAIVDRNAPADLIESLRLESGGKLKIVFVEPGSTEARDAAIRELSQYHWQRADGSAEKATQTAEDTRKVTLTPKQQKQFRKLMQYLTSEIKRINPLADVEFFERFIGFTRDGTAVNVMGLSHLLQMAVGLGGRDPLGTARHEAGHTVLWLMDQLNAWKGGEREALVEWVNKTLKEKHKEFLKPYDEALHFEEAIVQEMGVNRNKWKGYPKTLRNALFRIDGILKSIRSAIRRAFGRKLRPEDVADMLDAGVLARRAKRKIKGSSRTTKGKLAHSPDGSVAYQISEETLRETVFSSQLDNVLNTTLKPETGSTPKTSLRKGTGAQWRAELLKRGVKMEELKDSGLEMLFSQNNNTQMTYDDVVQVREAMRIELHAVVLDDGTQAQNSEAGLLAKHNDSQTGRLKLSSVLSRVIPTGLAEDIEFSIVGGRFTDAILKRAKKKVTESPESYETDTDFRNPYVMVNMAGRQQARVNTLHADGSVETGVWFHAFDGPHHHYPRSAIDDGEYYRDALGRLVDLYAGKFRGARHSFHTDMKAKYVGDMNTATGDRNDTLGRDYEVVIWDRRSADLDNVPLVPGDEPNRFKYWATVYGKTPEMALERAKKFMEVYEPPKTTVEYRDMPASYLVLRTNQDYALIGSSVMFDGEGQASAALLSKNSAANTMFFERAIDRAASDIRHDGQLIMPLAIDYVKNFFGATVEAQRAIHDSEGEWAKSLAITLVRNFPIDDYGTFQPYLTESEAESWARGDTENNSSDIQFETWNLAGGKYRREFLVTTPTMAREDGTSAVLKTHFSSYRDKQVIAHTRMSEFNTEEGEVMNVVEENQSDAMQHAAAVREELIKDFGFAATPELGFGPIPEERRLALEKEYVESSDRRHDIADQADAVSNAASRTFNRVLHRSGGPNDTAWYDMLSRIDGMNQSEVGEKAAQFLSKLEVIANRAGLRRADLFSGIYEYVSDGYVLGAAPDINGAALKDNDNMAETIRKSIVGMRVGLDSAAKDIGQSIAAAARLAPGFIPDLPPAKTLAAQLRKARRLNKEIGKEGDKVKKVRSPQDLPETANSRTQHKKSYSLMLLKLALHEAVKNGAQWIGFTTGDQQVERYGYALRSAVNKIQFKLNNIRESGDIVIHLNNGNERTKRLRNISQRELARYIGRSDAERIFKSESLEGEIRGRDMQFKNPGVLNHYDKTIPSDIKPLLDQYKMTLVDKPIGSYDERRGFTQQHVVRGARLTPEAVADIKAGNLYRYQIEDRDIGESVESQLDNVLMPDSPTKTKLTKGTGAQWKAELLKQGVKLEELRDAALESYLDDNKDSQITYDRIFQYRQGNRIDVKMRVLTDGGEPLAKKKDESATAEKKDSDQSWDLTDRLGEIGLDSQSVQDSLYEVMEEAFNDVESDYDTERHPRARYEAQLNETTNWTIVKMTPEGEVDDWVEGHGDDEVYAERDLKGNYGNGERMYVAQTAENVGDKWTIQILDDWGDGDEVIVLEGDSHKDVVDQAKEYIKDNSPYYELREELEEEWDIYDHVDESFSYEHRGETKRFVERAAERANDEWYDQWREEAYADWNTYIRSNRSDFVELLTDAISRATRSGVDDAVVTEAPGYEEAAAAYLRDNHGLDPRGSGGDVVGGRKVRSDIKFATWNLSGGKYLREYLLTAPNLDQEALNMRTHFGSVGIKIFAHFRANDYHTEDGGVAVVAQEFQSDVHQDASDARQTLIKKLGFAPNPMLGYGREGPNLVRKVNDERSRQRAHITHNVDTLDANLRVKLFDALMDKPITGEPAEVVKLLGEPGPQNFRVLERWMYGAGITYSNVESAIASFLGKVINQRAPFAQSVTFVSRIGLNEAKNQEFLAKQIMRFARKMDPITGLFPGAQSLAHEIAFNRRIRSTALNNASSEIVNLPEISAAPSRTPHKQSWQLLQFKILLHEAITNGYDYLAMTTGDQQVERYRSALTDSIKDIDFDIVAPGGKGDISINLKKNGGSVHKLKNVDEAELARYVGKETASNVFNGPTLKGTLPAEDVSFKSPGILNHYDRAIQSDTKKFLADMGMTWGKIGIGSWRTITPEAPKKQTWRLIQRGVRPDGTVDEATVDRDSEVAIQEVMQRADALVATPDGLQRYGYASYSHELISPDTSLPAPVPERKFNKMHDVWAVKISDKARMWVQGSPEQPTRRFLKYQIETPEIRKENEVLRPGDTSTPQFKAWFDGSTVVNEDGSPLKVYRGTQVEPKPTAFYTRKTTPSFTPDPYVASVYTRGPWGSQKPGASVHPVYLSIKKPLDLRALTEHATLYEIFDLLPWDFSKTFGEKGKTIGLMELADLVESLEAAVEKGGAHAEVNATSIDGVHHIGTLTELAEEISALDADEMTNHDHEALSNMLSDVSVDTYVIADSDEWVYMLTQLGFDGVVHKDPFVGGIEHYEGDKSKFELGHNDDPVHDTYRPFTQAQIKGINNRGTWDKEQAHIMYQVEHHNTPEFKRFFGKSIATESGEPGGKPARVYRGQHGESSGDLQMQSRFKSITFTDDPEVSSEYALRPNDWTADPDGAKAPTSIPAYIRIENPIWVERKEPFISFGPLIKKLGREPVEALLDDEHIYNSIIQSNYWEEEFYPTYGTDLRAAIKSNPGLLEQLDVEGFRMLDDHAFVAAAKAKGYDGAIQAGTGVGHGSLEYRVFDERQVKSAIGNSGAYSRDDSRINYQQVPKGFAPSDPQVNTPRFKVWWKKSRVVDAVGHPLRVYHGSLNDIESFRPGTAEGFLGSRFYFTSDPVDASRNYASKEGPDIRVKADDYIDKNMSGLHQYGTPEYKAESDKLRKAFFAQNTENHGVVYPVYLSIQNPLFLGGIRETEMRPREIVRLAQASLSVAREYGIAALGQDKVLNKILLGIAAETEHYGLKLSDLMNKVALSDEVYDLHDLQGNLVVNELLRASFEKLGYDGVIDYGAGNRWPNMGIKPGAAHYIAFRPNQIKSVFNDGSWSNRMDHISYQFESGDITETPKFKKWFDDGALKDAAGKPMPVFHATDADFVAFKHNRHDIGIHVGTAGQANERGLGKFPGAEGDFDPEDWHGLPGSTARIIKMYANFKNPLLLEDRGSWFIESVIYQLQKKVVEDPKNSPFTVDEILDFEDRYKDKTGVWAKAANAALRKALYRKGYDSIKYLNNYEREGLNAATNALISAERALRKAVERLHPGKDLYDHNLPLESAPMEFAAVQRAKAVMDAAKQNKEFSYIAFYPSQLKSVFNAGAWSKDKRHLMYQHRFEDAADSGEFIDNLRQGFYGEWNDVDETVALSSNGGDLLSVYRKDWLDMRRGPNNFQFAIMLRGKPVGRVNGVIEGDTARLNWIGIIGGDSGLGGSAIRHLGAMLRLALPSDVRMLTGLRKGPEGAYATEEKEEASKPRAANGRTQVRTPGGAMDDPLIDYYQTLGAR